MLATLGIPPEQERLYASLIAHPGRSLADLAGLSATPVSSAAALLDELVASGLVVVEEAPGSSESPSTRYRAAAPSLTLMPMLLQRRALLDQAEATVAALVERHRRTTSPAAGGVVEVIHGATDTRLRFAQLLGAAQHEVVVFPTEVAVAVDQGEADPIVKDALRRGVLVRTVISRRHLRTGGTMEAAQQSLAAGVLVRVAEDIPVRMVVSDRSHALMSLTQEDGCAEADSLVIHGTALVQALTLLFEQYWRRAHALPPAPTPGVADMPAAPHPTDRDRLILSLLSLGESDRQVAVQLGISLRTVERRIQALMKLAGGRSRFQLGCYAAQNGWLTVDYGSGLADKS
ncbi:helix-turn-helix transcriptional regulator [Streptomyces wedmorensis]|uniref:helix-turn-helix transcriptional regulator n=1 Tax=Streptomyces wedmorensis TaxID=43759 RepID=UPI0037AC48A1